MTVVKKDNKLMSLLSVWGILLVLLGHSGFEEPVILENLTYLHNWIYSFHMPLFFMISGYLFSFTNKSFMAINSLKFMQKKVVRLLVPYVVLGVVLYSIKFAFSGLSHATRNFSVNTFLKMFISPGCEGSTMGYLWYMFTLFMVFAVVVLLSKMCVDMKKVGWCLVVMVVFWTMSVLLPRCGWLNWNTVCRDLPYFVLGILLYRYEARILLFINRFPYNLLVFSALSVYLQFVELPFPGWLSHIIEALIGLMMSIQLCSMLLKCNWVEKCLLPLGKYTYCIYLLSWFGHYAAKIVLVNVLHVHWVIVVPGMFVFGLLVPLAVCKVVEKMDWLNKRKWLHLVIGY